MRSALPLLLVIAGCTDGRGITETGNPEMEMAWRARTSAPEAVSIDAAATAPVRLESVWVSIDDVKFVQGEVCDAPGEVEYDAPAVVVDLLADPEPVRFEVGEGAYCRVRVRLDEPDSAPDGAPDALAEASLVVTGALDDGTPFVIVSEATPEADVRSRSEPFDLAEGRDRLIMAFDVAKWFEGVDLATGVVTDGVIRVGPGSNEALLAAFEASVARALALYDDVDGSGTLDDDEDDAPLASAE